MRDVRIITTFNLWLDFFLILEDVSFVKNKSGEYVKLYEVHLRNI